MNKSFINCRGLVRGTNKIGRRELLRLGLGGFTSLSMPGLFNLRNLGGAENQSEKTAIILVWLRGGCSHLDTFDPKPDSPAEYRGPFKQINTNVPGIQLTELLPGLAGIANKYTLLRSIAHSGGGHPAGSLQMLSGDPDAQDKPGPKYPDWMSIANYLRSGGTKSIPNYVAVNPVDRYDSFTIAGSTYLGSGYDAFKILGDPNNPQFSIPNIGLKDFAQRDRLAERVGLRKSLSQVLRSIDETSNSLAMDQFERQALDMFLSPKAQTAFDLSLEPEKVRDRYGRNSWGQQCLMARRLVESGVDIVTTEFDGPLCGRVANWDDHAVNHHVFDALKYRAPFFDQAVTALIEDIYARGLEKRVLVAVGGEFGRTPRISHVASSGGGVASAAAGVVQPGRDHWPRAGSFLFAGGGIQTGQIIGATDKKGEDPISRKVSPEDFLATIYQHLGIDYKNIALKDFSGRPTPIIRSGEAITELARTQS
ncbi:MAG: DUF1501 domain-containing protein [Planctomycetes bacterium]|nr:DUF1501 domain-containing protein [Planctomycetota bacterium]